MPKSLSQDMRNDIRSALLNSREPKDIANDLGIHASTVRRYRKRFFPQQSPLPAGRRTIVSDVDKQYIKILIIRGQLKTAKEVHKKLTELGHSLSYSSAVNVLKSMNFHAKLKKRKPLLTKQHRKRRLTWAMKYRNWSVEQWRQVVFSDETKFNIWGSDGVRYYWVTPNDVLRPHHIDVTVKHGGGKINFWGCITGSGPGYGCKIYGGNMDSKTYQHILSTTYMDTLKYYGMNKSLVYLQHDNDPKHKSKSTIAWLNNNAIRYIDDWPAQSPDLNPIEHVWHHIKLNLSLYETRAKNVSELWDRIDIEWNKLDADTCRRYIDSMPDRIEAVIRAKGGYTRY